MSKRAQKIQDEFQEGRYKKSRGRTVNVGKPIKQTGTYASGSASGSGLSQPPPVPTQGLGEMDTGPDYSGLDPQLPTEEEVRATYGKVRGHIANHHRLLTQPQLDSERLHENVATKTIGLPPTDYCS